MLDSLLISSIFIPICTCVMLTLGSFLIRQSLLFVGSIGEGEGIRALDFNLGKVAVYK